MLPITMVYPTVGFYNALLVSFIVVIISGLGEVKGVIFVGIIMGIMESIVTAFFLSEYATLVSFAVLVTILVLKPKGLFGKGWDEEQTLLLFTTSVSLPNFHHYSWLFILVVFIFAMLYSILSQYFWLTLWLHRYIKFWLWGYLWRRSLCCCFIINPPGMPSLLSIVIGVLFTIIVTLLIGLICLRLRGPYMAIGTLLFDTYSCFTWIVSHLRNFGFHIGGGLRTVVGPVLGAFSLTFISEFFRFIGEFRFIRYGIIVLVVMLLFPRGQLVSLSISTGALVEKLKYHIGRPFMALL